ncbi:MAG: YraN family protein [Clostridia bacterium]|nr:YraN family protein [Clostridia bacterium]
MNSNIRGKAGEAMAADFLRARGYTILDAGYRSAFGEIDLIAKKRNCVAFVEVKLRKNDRFSRACEAVTPAKQDRLRQTALQWVSQYGEPKECRFDVIEIYTQTGEICHLEGAFV